MRVAARSDQNQARIVQALRKAGASVIHLHQLGRGVPDILACFRGRNILMEIKRPGEKPNEKQIEFHSTWGGELHVVRTEEEAIAALNGDSKCKKESRLTRR